MKKRRIIWAARIVIWAAVLWVLWANTALQITEYSVSAGDLPEAFDGFRIVQISDLHNAEFGENNEKLLKMIMEAEPDIIVLTGDLVDSNRTDIDIALRFTEEAVMIAPTYYVSGNHESRIGEYETLKTGMEAAGVVILENESVTLEREGESIALMGVMDPAFRTGYLAGDERATMASQLEELESEGYTILLSHRPELFDAYVQVGVSLVFSGHAHGGQFRLPFIGGLFAPGQGWFPEYDAGIFTDGDTTMVVSRGLGASSFPLRFNNRPEIVIVTLEST